jgi:hypothetical protein
MNVATWTGAAVEVHVWGHLSYRDLLPLLETLQERFPDVRTRRETEGPVQAGGADAGLTLTILAGVLGAEVLKTFLSELTKDVYRGLRTQLLRLFPRAGAAPGALRFLPMSIVIGPVRLNFEGELSEEEFLRRLHRPGLALALPPSPVRRGRRRPLLGHTLLRCAR